jgi:hypothetical protein
MHRSNAFRPKRAPGQHSKPSLDATYVCLLAYSVPNTKAAGEAQADLHDVPKRIYEHK